MTTTSIVLLFGSDVDAGHVSVLANERSRLQTFIDEAPGVVEVNLITLGLEREMPGITEHVALKGLAEGPIDAVLRGLGAFALRRKLAAFPIGRLLNSMGPVDPGRVFWRAVRRDKSAMGMLLSADIAIAADLPAAKTAWIALHRHLVNEAHYDPRSAAFGQSITEDESTTTPTN